MKKKNKSLKAILVLVFLLILVCTMGYLYIRALHAENGQLEALLESARSRTSAEHGTLKEREQSCQQQLSRCQRSLEIYTTPQ